MQDRGKPLTIGAFGNAAGVSLETIRFHPRRRILPLGPPMSNVLYDAPDLVPGAKMNSIRLSRILDKTGVLGTVVSGFSCAACYPALASIGAAVGLGFLSRWEGLFVHVLIPIFLLIALLANALGWFAHRQWHRAALGSAGPLIALVADLGMTQHFLPVELARLLFYAGIVLMVIVSIRDILNPANRRCAAPASDTKSNSR